MAAKYRWIGKGVLSHEGKHYGHGDEIPEIHPKTLKLLIKQKRVEKIGTPAPNADTEKWAAEKAAKEAADKAAAEGNK